MFQLIEITTLSLIKFNFALAIFRALYARVSRGSNLSAARTCSRKLLPQMSNLDSLLRTTLSRNSINLFARSYVNTKSLLCISFSTQFRRRALIYFPCQLYASPWDHATSNRNQTKTLLKIERCGARRTTWYREFIKIRVLDRN